MLLATIPVYDKEEEEGNSTAKNTINQLAQPGLPDKKEKIRFFSKT